MAKVQSRRTITIAREDHADLSALCSKREIPMSQAATQAIRALIAGRIQLEPAKTMFEVGAETSARRGLMLTPQQVKALRPPLVVPDLPGGTCALCIEVATSLIPTKIDPDKPPFRLCPKCHKDIGESGEPVAAA